MPSRSPLDQKGAAMQRVERSCEAEVQPVCRGKLRFRDAGEEVEQRLFGAIERGQCVHSSPLLSAQYCRQEHLVNSVGQRMIYWKPEVLVLRRQCLRPAV